MATLAGKPYIYRITCKQGHSHADPPDNQYAVFALNFAGNIGGESAVAGIDLTRFQRASKGAHRSAGGRGDDVSMVELCDSCNFEGSTL